MPSKSKIVPEDRQIDRTELPSVLGAKRSQSLATPPYLAKIAINSGNFKVKGCHYYVRIIVNN